MGARLRGLFFFFFDVVSFFFFFFCGVFFFFFWCFKDISKGLDKTKISSQTFQDPERLPRPLEHLLVAESDSEPLQTISACLEAATALFIGQKECQVQKGKGKNSISESCWIYRQQ